MPDERTPIWSSLPLEVYEGKGDQWDIYRSQRDVIGSDWSAFRPRTNILVSHTLGRRKLFIDSGQWLQYLVRYLLHRTKTLRRPKLTTATRSRRARAPRKSDSVDQSVLAAYTCLLETEQKLANATEVMGSAQDLIAWAKASGFLL
jgi:serine/threonine-protein kinase haspin